jgi:outer membrane protein assembly factor BamB
MKLGIVALLTTCLLVSAPGNAGREESAPLVVGGNTILAFDPVSGDLLWEYLDLNREFGSPVIFEDHCYCNFGNGLICLDLYTGLPEMTVEAGSSGFSKDKPPEVTDDWFVGFDGQDGGIVDRNSGRLVWSHAYLGATDPSVEVPFILDDGLRYVRVLPDTSVLQCFDAITEELLWTTDVSATFPSYAYRMADRFLLCCDSGQSIKCISAAEGHILWSIDLPIDYPASFCTDGERLYLLAADGAYCLDMDSGRQIWGHDDRIRRPSGLLGAGHLLSIADSGAALCWDDEDGSLQWARDAGSRFAAASTDSSHLLLRYSDKVCCISLESGSELWSTEIRPSGWQPGGIIVQLFHEPDSMQPLADADSTLFLIDVSMLTCVACPGLDTLWRSDMGTLHARIARNSSCGYVLVQGGVAPNWEPKVYCLDPYSGRIVWSAIGSYSLPHMEATPDFGDVVFLLDGSYVTCREIATGMPVWRTPVWESGLNHGNPEMFALSSGAVLVRQDYSKLMSLDLFTGAVDWIFALEEGFISEVAIQTDTVLVAIQDDSRHAGLVALDLESGTELYRLHLPEGSFPDLISLQYLDGALVALDEFNGLARVDIESGGIIWTIEEPDSCTFDRTWRLLAVSDALICLQEQHIQRIDPEAGQVLWTTTIPFQFVRRWAIDDPIEIGEILYFAVNQDAIGIRLTDGAIVESSDIGPN